MFKSLGSFSVIYGASVSVLANVENEIHVRESYKYSEFPPMVPLSTVDSISIFIRNCAMPSIALLTVPVTPLLLLTQYPYRVYCRALHGSESVHDMRSEQHMERVERFITKIKEPCNRNRDFICDTVTEVHNRLTKGKGTV